MSTSSTGISTTVPFFLWLFDQPEFIDGRVHTAYLDEVLRERNGRPFTETTRQTEEVAAIAAAVHKTLSARADSGAAAAQQQPVSQWKATARSEALR